jgi:hypothetical protein
MPHGRGKVGCDPAPLSRPTLAASAGSPRAVFFTMAHAVGSNVERAYRRTDVMDMRSALMGLVNRRGVSTPIDVPTV